MSFTTADAYSLFALIRKYEEQPLLPKKFAWALLRNKKKLLPVVEALEELRKAPSVIAEFEEARINLCKEYAEKDENGEPKTKDSSFVIPPESLETLQSKIGELREQHKDAIEAQRLQFKEIEEVLATPANADLYKVPLSYLPEQISPVELEIFAFIIEDESPTCSVK